MGKSFVSFGRKLTATSCAFVLGVILMLAGKTSQAAAPQFVRHTIDTAICITGATTIDLGAFLAFSDADGAASTETFTVLTGPAGTSPAPASVGTLTLGSSGSYIAPGSAAATNLPAGVASYASPAGNYGAVSFVIRVSDGTSTDQVTINVRMLGLPVPGITTPYVQVHQGQQINYTAVDYASSIVSGSTVTATWSTVPGTNATINAAGVLTGVNIGYDTLFYTLNNGTCPAQESRRTISVVTGTAPNITLPTAPAGPINVKTSYGDTLVLSGSGFNTAANNYVVYFGGAKGTVTDVTTSQIKVVAPKGATYGALQVIDQSSQLVTIVPNSFIPHHDSTGFIKNYTASQLFGGSAVSSYSVPGATGGPYSIEFADLDGDGDNEMIVSGTSTNKVLVFNNNGTYGSVNNASFVSTPLSFPVAAAPISLKYADFDGDGKLDIATVAAGAAQVSILRNTSTSGTPDFATRFDVPIPGALPSELAIADFNKDGRPDIAIAMTGANDTGVYTGTGYVPTPEQKRGRFIIIRNNYNKAPGQFMNVADFDTATAFLYDTAALTISYASPISVATGDLNGDGKADVAISVHNQRSVDIYRNTSTIGGNISFSRDASVSTATGSGSLAAGPTNSYTGRSGYPEQVRIGDLDNDGKPDLAVAVTDSDLLQTNVYNVVALVRNTSSSGGAITFAAQDTVSTGAAAPVALALGDLDGDGLLDIVASNSGGLRLSIITHKDAAGITYNAAYQKYLGALTAAPVCPAIGDIDGNSIPDIAVVSRTDKKVYFFRNYPVPDTTTPAGDSVLCNGGTGKVISTHRPTAAYGTWRITGNGHVSIDSVRTAVVGTTTEVDTVYIHGTAVAGMDTLSYTVTSLADTNMVSKFPVRTLATSSPGVISILGGGDSICVAHPAQMQTTGAPGGVWSSTFPTIATVNSVSGLAGGVAAGVDTIKYKIVGCPDSSELLIRVIAPPTAGPITNNGGASASAICSGTNDTLHVTGGTHGGNWTHISGTGSITIVSTSVTHDTVVVNGVTAGTDTLVYTAATDCGTATSRYVITVNTSGAAPSFATGPRDSTCNTTDLPLTVTTLSPTAGVWASSNSAVATVVGTGTSVNIHPTTTNAGFTVISYTASGCYSGTATDTIYVAPSVQSVTINGPTKLCNGADVSLTPSLSPIAGIAYSWSSSNTAIASVNASTGALHGASVGIATISYSQMNACRPVGSPFVVTYTDTVDAAASAGTVSGSGVKCAGDDTVYTNPTATAGTSFATTTWSSSATSVATIVASTGAAHMVAGGTTTITSSTLSCDNTVLTATRVVTVNPLPTAGGITNNTGLSTSALCAGSNDTLHISTGTHGGNWSARFGGIVSLSTSVTHDSVYLSGLVAGTDTVIYKVTTGCGVDSSRYVITVNTSGAAPSFATGPRDSTCNTTDLPLTVTTLSPTAGVWASSNPAVATVLGTGTSVSIHPTTTNAGFTVISYATSGCYSGTATDTIYVAPDVQNTVTVNGPTKLCNGLNVTLSPSLSPIAGIAYSWSSSNTTIASINASTGVLHGASVGIATISYSQMNACRPAGSPFVVTYTDTVDNQANAGTVVGPIRKCAGDDTVYANPTATSTTTYATTTWSSSATTVATIIASGSSAGAAHMVGAGTTTITSSTLGCDNTIFTATRAVTVDVIAPDNITGLSQVCRGATITLGHSLTTTGTWTTSSNTNLPIIAGSSTSIATVQGGSAVTLSSVIETITFTAATGCGPQVTTKNITVLPPPNAGTVTGSMGGAYDSLCASHLPVAFGNSGTIIPATNGSWSSFNTSVATVDAVSGVVSITLPSTADTTTIRFTTDATYACGTAQAGRVVKVKAMPNPGSLSTPAAICYPATSLVTITNTVAHPASTGLGIWRAVQEGVDDANASLGTVTATSAQFFPSATTTAGLDPYHTVHVYFIDTNFCGRDSTSTIIAVKTVPVVAPITSAAPANSGLDSMCKAGSPLGHTILGQVGAPATSAGGALTLSWSASNNVVLTLSGASTANVTLNGGTAAGVDTITYAVNNGCGTGVSPIRVIKVIAPKDGGTIVAPDIFCTPDVIQLYDTAANGDTARNGNWDVPVGFNISIGTSGSDFGQATAIGFDPTPEVIRYTPLPNYCGATAAVKSVTLNDRPNAGTISGDTTVCVNATTVLTDDPGNGYLWFSNDTTIARVDLAGTVTGRNAGFTQINYVAAVVGCGTDTASHNMEVKALSPVGFIFGQDTSCVNGSVQLYDTVSIAAGGVWSSSNTAIASINATTGLVTAGLTGGQATITYATSNGCGPNDTTFTFRVFDIPRLTSTTTPPQTCDSANFTYTATADTAGTKFAWTRATVTNLLPLTAQDTVAGISEYLDNTGNAVLVASYVYTLTAHGCVNNATVNVNVVPTPRLTTPLFDTICSGQTFVYSDTESTGPTTTATWTRPVVAGITPATIGNGVHGISEQLTSSNPNSAITVTYVYTLSYLGCPSHTENVYVEVDPVGGTPKITTHSPDALCSGTMYQNFGAETTPPANVTYRWSSSNAQVWATGGTQQYSLVNFTEAGNAVVYLKASASGFGNCFSYDSFAVTVSPNVSDNPEVYYFNGDFVCLSNIQDTYQWGYDSRSTLDSALFVGETNQAFNVPTPDFTNKYYFVMTTHNGCSQKSYFIVPTGVQNVTASMGEMSLYPNPASNMLNVEINNTPGGKYKVEVVDLLGHKINTSDVVNNRTTLDVADLAAGMYMVNCYRDGVKFASAKFVKN